MSGPRDPRSTGLGRILNLRSLRPADTGNGHPSRASTTVIFAVCIPFVLAALSLATVLVLAGSHVKFRELARDAERFEEELRQRGA